MRDLSSYCALLLVWLAQVTVAQFNSEQYKSELFHVQKSLMDIRVQIAVEKKQIEELKKGIAAFYEKNARFNSESGFSGDDVEAALYEISDLPVEQKKLIQTQSSFEKIASFLNMAQGAGDLKASKAADYSFVAINETFLNTARSVYKNSNLFPYIYFNKKPTFSNCYRNQKRIGSTIQPFRLSIFKPAADYSNNKADKL
ncbi:MAG: hypothetical protein GX267_12835 [Fibrobacter sp.]|jgi:septal ring factor EnvC (AmiA/AmiB activator)|nr:hypothetical protein [Fibrobacter sp.]